MSPLTDHDQFYKPQSNGDALLRNETLPFVHAALFRSNNVTQSDQAKR